MNIEAKNSPLARRGIGAVQRRCIILLLTWVFILLPFKTVAAVPGDLDDTFLGTNYSGTDGTVYDLAIQPDGKIVLVGQFTYLHSQLSIHNIVRLNSDGSLDPTFNPGLGTNRAIYLVRLLANGQLMVGGDFTTYNAVPISCIARLNSDGSRDQTFISDLQSPLNGFKTVRAIAPLADGDFLVGGLFEKVGSRSVGNLVRLNNNGSYDEENSFLDGVGETGANETITAIAPLSGGKMYIAGRFTTVNGTARGRIARLNADGSVDPSFLGAGEAGANNEVETLTVLSDGRLLVGGSFTAINDVYQRALARLTSTGTLDTTFTAAIGDYFTYGRVVHISSHSDGKLLITGNFTQVNGVASGNVVRLMAGGDLDTTFMDGEVGADDGVYAASVQPGDGKIVLGGTFGSMNGTMRTSLARLNMDGTLDRDFLIAGANNEITAIAVQPQDGKILVSGGFDIVNGHPKMDFMRLHPDGSVDQAFMKSVSGVNGRVNTIVVTETTLARIYIGGSFSDVHGESISNIARLDDVGYIDWEFHSSPVEFNGEVHSLVLQPNGKLLVGGSLAAGGGQVVRLNGDGSPDTSFTGPVINNLVYSMALQPDGKIVIVGAFTSVGGQPRAYIARLNANGSLDTTYLSTVTGANNVVRWVDLDFQGNAVIGGWFTQVNGSPFQRVARLSKTNGSPDQTFLKNLTGPDNGVRALAVQRDGSIIIGGEFENVNNVSRPHLARLHRDGSLDTSFMQGESAAPNGRWINSVVLQPDGDMFIGGDFTLVNQQERGRIARLEGHVFQSVYLPMLKK